jgi:hypothetical protein
MRPSPKQQHTCLAICKNDSKLEEEFRSQNSESISGGLEPTTVFLIQSLFFKKIILSLLYMIVFPSIQMYLSKEK